MKLWKIVLEHWGSVIELEIKAESYADAYIKAGTSYPNCSVISIKQLPAENGKKKNN